MNYKHPEQFSKLMREELPEKKKNEILRIIDEIAGIEIDTGMEVNSKTLSGKNNQKNKNDREPKKTKVTPIYPEMIPLKEASARTGISYDRLRKMCMNDEVAHFRTGRKWLINFGTLCAILNGDK